MKKIILVAVMLVVGYTAQSQVLISLLFGDKLNSDKIDFGLEGGYNFSKISGMDSKRYMPDWNLGFYFVIQMKKSWYVNTGVLVKAKTGTGYLTGDDLNFLNVEFPDTCTVDNGNYHQKINAFMVPVMVRYMFKNRFYLEGGLQGSLRYKAWVEYTSETDDFDVKLKRYNKEATNPIDVGALAGVGYRLKGRTGMTFGMKYYYGFANIYKGVPGSKNSAFFLKLNIPIGAGEKAQKKRAERAAKRKTKRNN
jgi:hypothetical protein